MSTMAVAPIESTEFRATIQPQGNTLQLYMWGNADLRVKDALDDFLTKVDGQAKTGPVDEVVVDLRELLFMNSSCLKALVTWLSAVQRKPQPEQYKIRFLRQPDAHWQVRSLGALAAFAPGIVQVE
jgi:hypothetical protein